MKAELDRRVTSAVAKTQAKAEAQAKAAVEKAKREAEEKRLIDDDKTAELLALRTAELEEYRAKEAARTERDKFSALLDNRSCTPEERRLLLDPPKTIEELDVAVKLLREISAAHIEAEVSKRLGTSAPPRGAGAPKPKTLPEQIAEARAAGQHDRALYLTTQQLLACPASPRAPAQSLGGTEK